MQLLDHCVIHMAGTVRLHVRRVHSDARRQRIHEQWRRNSSKKRTMKQHCDTEGRLDQTRARIRGDVRGVLGDPTQ
jgi:hypothetical protein